jgi:probable blue pigment (indigoidine) exporter
MNPTMLLSALAPVAWGTTYLVTTELMPAERPLLTAAVRVLPIGLLLTLRARRLPRGAWWWRTAVLGALNIGVFQALLFDAAYRLPGGVAATAGAVQPLVVGVLAAWLLAERLRPGMVLAAVGGVVGVGLLVLTPEARLDPVGVGAALIGTVSMATGVVLTKRWGRPVDLVTATGWHSSPWGCCSLHLRWLSKATPLPSPWPTGPVPRGCRSSGPGRPTCCGSAVSSGYPSTT